MPFDTEHPGSVAFKASFAGRTREISADYTATLNADQTIVCDTSGGAITVTLPPVAAAHDGNCGAIFRIVCLSASNDVTIDGDGSETIDGATTDTVSGAYASATVQCVGSEWVTL